mmetsp:Transcript_37757/g.90330  ORF Transcript_37757/g.90330 Transcript_37757/m.90330 type:complete len:568 (+) Transcript_37757:384-2087(+)
MSTMPLSSGLAVAGVTTVMANDIICGRGGVALKHPGNLAYRKIVGLNKELYATCLKTEKLRISKSIVAAIREIDGRFLEREDGKTSSSLDEKDENGNPVTWKDIGDKRAVEKTSQALREGQPKLLKKLAAQKGSASATDGNSGSVPVTVGYSNSNLQHNQQQVNDMQQQQHMRSSLPVNPLSQRQQMPEAFAKSAPPRFNPGHGGYQHLQQNLTRQPNSAMSEADQQNPPSTQSYLFENGGGGNNNFLSAPQQGHTFTTFPRNSFVDGRMADRQRASQVLRTSSRTSQDSWGEPTPLPFDDPAGAEISLADQRQLMTALDAPAPTVDQSVAVADSNKRPSVRFQERPGLGRKSNSAMSLVSHLSELSIFDDALSLDSALDAAQREAEFEMLGEFDNSAMSIGTMSIGTFADDLGASDPSNNNMGASGTSLLTGISPLNAPRRSILRRKSSMRWTGTSNSLPSAALSSGADPGMVFTSTLDMRPGGLNAGTDVSGLLGERRRSVVAFEVGVVNAIERRRSSRMSACSALTDASAFYKRDVGSVLSIQSADFRELMAEIDDESIDTVTD